LINILKCAIHCQLHELTHIATTCKANLENLLFFEEFCTKLSFSPIFAHIMYSFDYFNRSQL
jgi:hypothetical protein